MTFFGLAVDSRRRQHVRGARRRRASQNVSKRSIDHVPGRIVLRRLAATLVTSSCRSATSCASTPVLSTVPTFWFFPALFNPFFQRVDPKRARFPTRRKQVATTRSVVCQAAPRSGNDGESSSFRLDELGRSRARRRASFTEGPGVIPQRRCTNDLLEGPSTRVRRGAGRPAGASNVSAAASMKDAREPLLGMLDRLGNRAGRGSDWSVGRMGRARSNGFFGTTTSAVAAGDFGDVIEPPGRRVRRSEKARAVRTAAKKGNNTAGFSSSSSSSVGTDKKDAPLLGILSGPSKRVNRGGARRSAMSNLFEAPGCRVRRSLKMRSERAAAKERHGASTSSKVASEKNDSLLLGLLSGPSNRTGRAPSEVKKNRGATFGKNAPLLGILSGPGKRSKRGTRGANDSRAGMSEA